MSSKRKAPTREATLTGATETVAIGVATVPKTDSTTVAEVRQIKIADLLSHGAENGITLRHLEKMTGQDGRAVRRQIETERRAGALIISDNQHGYFLTDDPAEAKRFARSMKCRADQIIKTAQAVETAAGSGE